MTALLYNLDCRDVMSLFLDPNSVDSIVTDPPYGLGFMGKEWDHGVPGVEFWKAAYGVLKPGGYLLAFGGSRTYHRMVCAIEDAGFEIRDQIMWVYGSGFPKSHNLDGAHEGWGTALKPAHEPICVARKPFKGTVAANVLAHGTGAINIDASRVHADDAQGGEYIVKRFAPGASINKDGNWKQNVEFAGEMKVGRWPANIIHDGSDEVLAAFPQAPGQMADVSTTAPSAKTSNTYGAMKREGEPSQDSDNEGAVGFKMKPGARRLDAGSAARFFYCAKASRKDRNEGLSDPGPQFTHGATLRKIQNTETVGNSHPTVKPTDLMQYLCRLVTPPGGIVLDPFMGSGSTGKAAAREGFKFIGCELSPEYFAIAQARLAAESEKAA